MGSAADAILILHLVFIIFVATGGFLVLRWPRLIWLHLPCLAWGIIVEFAGWICPLTPLEIRLRLTAGETGYSGDFIDRYLAPVIYPQGLTHTMQIILGLLLILINAAIYAFLYHRMKSKAS